MAPAGPSLWNGHLRFRWVRKTIRPIARISKAAMAIPAMAPGAREAVDEEEDEVPEGFSPPAVPFAAGST